MVCMQNTIGASGLCEQTATLSKCWKPLKAKVPNMLGNKTCGTEKKLWYGENL